MNLPERDESWNGPIDFPNHPHELDDSKYYFIDGLLRQVGNLITLEDYLKAIQLAIEWGRQNPI
jgi:hypothetical protein